jgi:putative membrane protein
MDALYTSLEPIIPYLISLLFGFMLIECRRIWSGGVVAVLAGGVGVLSLSSDAVGQGLVLFPLLTGIFGISTLLVSLGETVPEQITRVRTRSAAPFVGGFIGSLAGVMAGFLPGLGPSGTLSIFASRINGSKEFLASIGGISTADALISLLALYIIGRPRSGAAIAVQKLASIDTVLLLQLLGISLLAISSTYLLAQQFLPRLLDVYNRFDHTTTILIILGILTIGVILATGIGGLGILLAATGVGLLADSLQVRKSLCMACLILPVILFHLGVSI